MMTPHFTLFVDAVFQMMDQYPTAFEFNLAYVFRIFEHSSSCQFGTVADRLGVRAGDRRGVRAGDRRRVRACPGPRRGQHRAMTGP